MCTCVYFSVRFMLNNLMTNGLEQPDAVVGDALSYAKKLH